MFTTTTSLIFASVLSGIIEGRYVLLSERRLQARQEEKEDEENEKGEIWNTPSLNVPAYKGTNLVIPSFAYGIISIPFTFLGAAPGPAIIETILDRSHSSKPPAATLSTITFDDSTNSNEASSSSNTSHFSSTTDPVVPNQQLRSMQQRWVRRSRNSIAQEARERNSSMSIPHTTSANASATNASARIQATPNVDNTSSTTKSRTATATSTATATNGYQRMIRFYHHQSPPTNITANTNAVVILGLQRLRTLFMATGLITGFIQFCITKQQQKQQQQQQHPPNTPVEESNCSNTIIPPPTLQYPTVIRFVPFQHRHANNQSDNHEESKVTILPMAAIPYTTHAHGTGGDAITLSNANNSLDYLNTTSANNNTRLNYSPFLSKTDEKTNTNATVLCEAYVHHSNNHYHKVESDKQSPFSLPQQKCISPTQLLVSTITLQRHLVQKTDVQKPFDIIRIILTDHDNNTTKPHDCCQLVVGNDDIISPPNTTTTITTTTATTSALNIKTLNIHFPHLVQYALLTAILESDTVGNDHEDHPIITNTTAETKSIKELTTDASLISSTGKINTRINAPALFLSSMDSLGKRVRSTITGSWQQLIDKVWNTAAFSPTNYDTEKNNDPKKSQQIVYLYPNNIDVFSSLPSLSNCANSRQLWIHSILKQHGIRTVIQKPLHTIDEDDHGRKKTILFCSMNDEETIGSMVNYFYHEKPKQKQQSVTEGISKRTNQVICLLERRESEELLRKILSDDHQYVCCCLEDIQEDAFDAVRKYLMQDYPLTDIEKILNEDLYSFATLEQPALE